MAVQSIGIRVHVTMQRNTLDQSSTLKHAGRDIIFCARTEGLHHYLEQINSDCDDGCVDPTYHYTRLQSRVPPILPLR